MPVFCGIIGATLTLLMGKASFVIEVIRIDLSFLLLERIRPLKLKQVLPLLQMN
jgi:hypothetical protein